MVGFHRKYGVRYKSAAREYIRELKSKGCSLCGYKKCLDALDFHHVNGAEKSAEIGRIKHIPGIIRELEKCILVCANCHREIHAGQIDGLYNSGISKVVPSDNDDQLVMDFTVS